MRDHAIFAALWAALTAAGLWVVERLLLPALPVAAAAEAETIDHSFALLARWSVPVAAFVFVMLAFAAVRFRARDPEGEESPVATRDNRWFSWSWLVLTAALNVYFILGPGVGGLQKLAQGSDQADLVVRVHATQWSFTFEYPQYGVTVKDQLVLPVGQRVRFEVTSDDVIHSFWVPAFRMKTDAVPGTTRVIYVTPNRQISTEIDPTARVQCAELCGVGHAQMRALLNVVDADRFQEWLVAQASGGDTGGGH